MFLNVIVKVYGQVLLQHLNWVFCIFVVFRTILSLYHYIVDSITNIEGQVRVSLLHLFCQHHMCLLSLVDILASLALLSFFFLLIFFFSALSN